jgi:phosphatidylinositol kinase/protein kinase (PI-3  family)
MNESNKAPEFSAPAEAARMTVNQQHLKQAWDTSQVSTREDWLEWMHRLAVEFMKESPSHALRACMSLVDVHPPLAKELFNAAFISCWRDLYEQYQVRRYLCFRRVKGNLENKNYRKTLSERSTSRLRHRRHRQSLYTDC